VEPFYAACMSSIKISILLFYWRLFKSVRWMRIGIYITTTMVLMWLIGAEVAAIVQCSPIRKFWNPGPDTPGHCLNGLTYFKSIVATNLVTDAIVLCLPMPLVWNINASVTRRISLACGFLIGGLYGSSNFFAHTALLTYRSVSLISIIRIVYLNNPHDPDTLCKNTYKSMTGEKMANTGCRCEHQGTYLDGSRDSACCSLRQPTHSLHAYQEIGRRSSGHCAGNDCFCNLSSRSIRAMVNTQRRLRRWCS
jgi:hypothetical protein